MIPAHFFSLQSLRLSKRFSPELCNFLSGIVFMSLPKDLKEHVEFVPPFKAVGTEGLLFFERIVEG